MPTKSTSRPGAMTSSTVLPAAAARSAGVGRVGGTCYRLLELVVGPICNRPSSSPEGEEGRLQIGPTTTRRAPRGDRMRRTGHATRGRAMTESEWLTSDDPQAMLAFVEPAATDRRLRLFVLACCRRLWGGSADAAVRVAMQCAERFGF